LKQACNTYREEVQQQKRLQVEADGKFGNHTLHNITDSMIMYSNKSEQKGFREKHCRGHMSHECIKELIYIDRESQHPYYIPM